MLIPDEERGARMAAFAIVGAIIGQLAPNFVAGGSTAMGQLSTALALVVIGRGVVSFVGYVFAIGNAPLSATEGV